MNRSGRWSIHLVRGLLVLGVIAYTGAARAFKPTTGHRILSTDNTHWSITENAILQAHKQYFNISKPTNSMTKAVEAIKNGNSDIDTVTGGLMTPANHFDEERFAGGQQVLMRAFDDVISNLQAKDVDAARRRLGNATHTLQDFYAHSTWVELGNSAPNPSTYSPFPAFVNVARGHTCQNCEGTLYGQNKYPHPYATACLPPGPRNSCSLNVTSTGLTTGYFALTMNFKPAGKCSHGGGWDETGLKTAPFGGINKDTGSCEESPHYYLHANAAEVARKATNLYFDGIKERVTFSQLKQLFGVGPTLVFVVDVSGSMQGIINAVKAQISGIIDKKIQQGDPPSQYVLMPFNDPGVGPLTVTDDPAAFKAALAALSADGGGDCPELAYAGMLKAVQSAQEGGEMFVFTDAAPKDSGLAGNVNSLAKKKDIKINPILFGKCSPISQAFITTAEDTGGQLFFMPPSDAGKIPHLADFIVRSNKVDILSIEDTFDTVKTYTVPVDSTLSKVTFSASRALMTVIRKPDGTVLPESGPGISVVTLNTNGGQGGGKVYSVDGPDDGPWTITLAGPGTFSLGVTGDSPLYLGSVQFVELAGRDPSHDGLVPISGLPSMGSTTRFAAQLTPEYQTASFELRSHAGALVQSLELTPDTGTGVNSFFGSTVLPIQATKFYVKGLDRNGVPYQRLLPSSVRPTSLQITRPALEPLIAGTQTSFSFPIINHGEAGTFKLTVTDSRGWVSNVTLPGAGGPPPP